MKRYTIIIIILAIIVSASFTYYMIGNKYVKEEDFKRTIQLYENKRIKILERQCLNNEIFILFVSNSDIDNFVGYAVFSKKRLYNKYEYISSKRTSFELSKEYVKLPTIDNPHTLVVFGKNTNDNIAFYRIEINGNEILRDISNNKAFLNIYKYNIPKDKTARVMDVKVYDQKHKYIGTR